MGGFNTYPALDIKQPQSPLESYGKAMQLKNLAGQTAMQPGQLELQQQQIEAQKRMLADKQAETAAMKEWSENPGKISMDELPNLVLKHGGSADAAMAWKKNLLEQQKGIEQLTKEKRDNALAKAGAIGNAAQDVLSLSEELRPQAYAQKQKELVQAGIITPEQVTPYDPDRLKIIAAGSLHAKEAMEMEDKKQTAAATALRAKTEADRLKWEQEGGGSAVDKREMNDWLAKNPDKGPSDFMKFKATLVPAYNFNLQSQGGPEVPLNDRQKNTAQAILEGRMRAPSGFALKTPYWQTIMGEVFKQDPQWSEQRAELRKSFTQDKEIGAINTALGHVGVLYDAIDAMGSNNVKALKAIGNRLGIELGTSSAVSMFNTIVHRVGPELSKAYIAGGGSAGERGTDEKDFDPNLGPKLLKDNAAITAQLLRSKISSKAFQWDQNKTEGMPSFQDKFITPEAKKTLEKLNPQKGGPAPARPKGVPAEAVWDEKSRTWSMP